MDWTCRSDTEKKKSIIHRVFLEEAFAQLAIYLLAYFILMLFVSLGTKPWEKIGLIYSSAYSMQDINP